LIAATKAPSESGTVKALGLVCPVLAVALAAPFIVGAVTSPDDLFLVAPALIGGPAAPGYVWALLGWRSVPSLPRGSRWWVRGSFAAVLGASLVGAVFSFVLILPSIASLLTAINGVVAWRRLEARAVAP
jgi:hypothetical protein